MTIRVDVDSAAQFSARRLCVRIERLTIGDEPRLPLYLFSQRTWQRKHPSLVGMTGPVYFLGALLLGAAMLACGLGLAATRSVGSARRLVYASIVYLPALFVLMAVDKISF